VKPSGSIFARGDVFDQLGKDLAFVLTVVVRLLSVLAFEVVTRTFDA
jgi:hypothetical protein